MWGLRMRRPSSIGLALGAALIALSFPAAAQEVVLKGVAAFQEGSIYAQKFEQYIKAVNEKGKGQIRIQYLGGAPKVMPLFDVGKNLKDGVIDIVTTSSAYYGNVLPEAEAMKLIEVSMAELRSNGGLAFLNKLHVDKANTQFLARLYNYERAHIFLNKEITKPDFSGLKIRVTPMYRPMVEKLGGTGINSTPPEVYTMLERNTVDGYGWATRGIFDYSWQKVTKFRVDPGFYHPDITLLANHDTWTKKLNDAQRKLLLDLALEIEASTADVGLIEAERKKQEEAGIKAIRFSPADEQRYTREAREAGWAVVNKISPENGPKLRTFFVKE
jgi:TRAP-type C4-dicarboxylate transport system substrate-binding protein